MSVITDDELLQKVDELVARFGGEIAKIIPDGPAMDLIPRPEFDDTDHFLGEVVSCCQDNLLENYFGNFTSLPRGNFLLYFVKVRDFRGFQDTVRTLRESGKISKEHTRRLLAGCLQYIRQELKSLSDDHERHFLHAFVTFIRKRGAIDQWFPIDAKIQTEFPVPKKIKVVDVSNPTSNKTIPVDEFISNLRDVSDRKDF